MRGAQHAGHQHFLAGQRGARFAEFFEHVGIGNRAGILPLGEILAGVTERAGARLIKMGADDERVVMEQLRDAFPLGMIQLALI